MKVVNSLLGCHTTHSRLLLRLGQPYAVKRRGFASNPSLSAGSSDPHVYCRELVRKHDYESFLISYFYPSYARRGYFAVKAFSVELATIQDHVSSAMIGKMRMQFWREAVSSIKDGGPPKHPIALALHETFQRHKISAYHLKRIVDARDAELTAPSHLTIDSLTSHAESTSCTVLYLLLSLLSLSPSTLSHAASHLGVAQTFSTLLRALPYHARQDRLVIPTEITSKHGVVQEEVFRKGSEARGIEDAVFEFATLAHDHVHTARSMLLNSEEYQNKVPKDIVPVFLAGVPVSNYLKRLEQSKFDSFDPNLQRRDGWLPLQLWWMNYKGRF